MSLHYITMTAAASYQFSGPAPSLLTSIAFANGYFIGCDGTRSFASQNGLAWGKAVTIGGLAGWHIAAGHNKCVTVSTAGQCAASVTGSTWTLGSIPFSPNWNTVCYGGGTYVALATGYYNSHWATSTDGLNYSNSVGSFYFTSMAYGGGFFVGPTSGTGASCAVSTNGGSFTNYTKNMANAATIGLGVIYTTIGYGNGYFISISGSSGGTCQVIISNNGVSWSSLTTLSSANNYNYIASDGVSRFVTISSAINQTAATEIIFNSPQDYSVNYIPITTCDPRGIAYGNGLFVLASYIAPYAQIINVV